MSKPSLIFYNLETEKVVDQLFGAIIFVHLKGSNAVVISRENLELQDLSELNNTFVKRGTVFRLSEYSLGDKIDEIDAGCSSLFRTTSKSKNSIVLGTVLANHLNYTIEQQFNPSFKSCNAQAVLHGADKDAFPYKTKLTLCTHQVHRFEFTDNKSAATNVNLINEDDDGNVKWMNRTYQS